MTIQTVRRLAADIMGVGRNKVRISPDGLKEAEGALTRSDVRGLIEKGVIKKAKPAGRASSGRRTRTGHGRRKGTPVDGKTAWMMKIRAQRRLLRMLLESGALKPGSWRAVYGKAKSGIFRNKKAMLLYLKENGIVPADTELPKAAFVRKERKAKAAPKPKAEAKAGKAAPAAAKAGPEKAGHKGHAHEHGEQRPTEKGEQR